MDTARSDDLSDRSASTPSTMAYALVWLPAAVLALYMKWVMLDQIGYLVVARNLGLDRDALSWFVRLGLYTEDVLLGFVLVPATLILMLYLLPRRLRTPAALAVSLTALAFLFINQLTYGNVGRFMSPRLAGAGAQWIVQNPSYLTMYASPSALIKLMVLVGATVALGWLAHRVASRPSAGGHRHGAPRRRSWALGGIIAPSIVALPLALAHTPGGYAASILRQTARSALSLDQPTEVMKLESPEEVRRAYRELANLPAERRSDAYFGALADYDVVFFVFETGPSRVVDFHADALEEFPNVRRLFTGSLVATNHHSTYPYTYSALFSLFSGLYPIGVTNRHLAGARLPEAPFARLAERGYQTAVYSPQQSQFAVDEEMFSALGFEHYVLAATGRSGEYERDPASLMARDRSALARMEEDLRGWLREGQRFAAVFLPQTSHAPWPDVGGVGADNHARGRVVLAAEDAMLGELIDLLERHGRLQQTLIVVTADHGLRTREEEPTLPPGQIDDISFRVPLLLYAPAAFGDGATIDWLTSHIDLAPTVLDLLGVPGDREHFQGVALWDEALLHRRTFFRAREYLGADGLHDEHGFYMQNDFLGVDYAAPHLRFGAGDLLHADHPRVRAGRAQLATLRALQERWMELVTRPPGATSTSAPAAPQPTAGPTVQILQ